MAKRDERTMLFDIRGRRRHVVKVVYAVLALLMGASLFLVVGPFNLGEALNTGGAKSATEALEDQAERIEGRLRKEPGNENLLLSLSRSRINAGNTLTETDPETGLPETTPEAKIHFEKAVESWERYVEKAGEPNPGAASLVAGTYFQLAETAETVVETEDYVSGAAQAQEMAAKARPSVGALSTLAIYAYYDGNFALGDKASARVEKLLPRDQAKSAKQQLATFRKRGKAYNKEVRRILASGRGQGKEQFENTLGGLSLGGSTLGE